MPDTQVLSTLVELRKAVGLRQEDAGEILGVNRKAISSWETGKSIPEKRHRTLFLKYLLEDLNLQDNRDVFESIWQEIAEELWSWEPLNAFEQWALHSAHRPTTAFIGVPRLPPFLNIHPLIGRSPLITNLKQHILTKRSVALVGIPGVGKTALAVAIAEDRDIENRFKDGVLWSSLGQRPDILGTLAQWGTELKIDVSNYPTPYRRSQALKSVIAQRQILIIIDDAWDLEAVELLQCGGRSCCHLVITRLQSLAESFTTVEQVVRVTELNDENGYQLLSRLAPDACAADQVSAQALARSVGGLPLALKVLGGYLAAPERRFFSSQANENIAELMDPQRRLHLALKRLGTENASPVTVQQVIELSLDNLPRPVIQTYFNLGAFAAKPAFFTRQAAETVTLCEISHLSLLIDRNLLEIGHKDQLTLHQVLADFTRTRTQRLMLDRHRDYYLDLINKDQNNWQLIETLYEQIRWSWQCQTQQTDDDRILMHFVNSLQPYQERRGLWIDYLVWAQHVLQVSIKKNYIHNIAALLNNIGWAHYSLGNRKEALQSYEDSLKLKRLAGDIAGESTTLNNIAAVYKATGQLDRALENCLQALPLSRKIQDVESEAAILNNLGTVYDDLGQEEDALDNFHQALSLQRQRGDQAGEALILNNIANVYMELGDTGAAQKYLQDALQIFRNVGDRSSEARALHNLGTLSYKVKQLPEALTYYQQALVIQENLQELPGICTTLYDIGHIYNDLDQEEKALASFRQALQIQEGIDDRSGYMQTLFFIGYIHEKQKDLPTALSYYQQAEQLAYELRDQTNQHFILKQIGDTWFRSTDLSQALTYYQKALPLILEVGTLSDEGSIRFSMAMVYRAQGRLDEAVTQMKRVVEIDRLLSDHGLERDLNLLTQLQGLSS